MWNIIIGIVATVALGIAGVVASHGHRSVSIWITYLSFALYGFVGFKAWDDAKPVKTSNGESSLKSQRARVVITGVVPEPLIPAVGEKFVVILKVKNIGQTPAKNLNGTVVLEPVQKGSDPDYSYANDRKVQVGFLAPDVDHHFRFSAANSISTGEERPLTSELLEQIKSGKIGILIHGRIDYEDVSGASHWIEFCYGLIVPFTGYFYVYPTHNGSDE